MIYRYAKCARPLLKYVLLLTHFNAVLFDILPRYTNFFKYDITRRPEYFATQRSNSLVVNRNTLNFRKFDFKFNVKDMVKCLEFYCIHSLSTKTCHILHSKIHGSRTHESHTFISRKIISWAKTASSNPRSWKGVSRNPIGRAHV